jgi:putative phage-type endonuclease
MTAALSPLRVGRVTGSRVAAVIGANRYQTREEVLAEMVAQAHGEDPLFNGNEATGHGHEFETAAIAAYEAERGLMTLCGQDFVIHPEHDFLAVTPDGYVGDDGLVEVKCPWQAGYTDYSRKPEYRAQMQLQMACTGRAWTDFIVYRATPRWSQSELFVTRLDADPKWLPKHLPALRAFIAEYREKAT